MQTASTPATTFEKYQPLSTGTATPIARDLPVASRDAAGQSRVFVIDAGAGLITPDIHFERDEFNSLTIRNRSTLPFSFRLQYSGTDNRAGTFEHAYGLYALPGKATLRLRLPADPADPSLTRELDLGSDGLVDSTEELPANGQLRIGHEGGMLALRWRPAARQSG